MQVVSNQPSEPGSARIRPLSVLPVFFDMTGKLAVAAGGTEGAAGRPSFWRRPAPMFMPMPGLTSSPAK
jgi:hypothetical protein